MKYYILGSGSGGNATALVNDNNEILKGQNIGEIKKFAQLVGENNLTEEDIKYGLSYGRSVIVEYLA